MAMAIVIGCFTWSFFFKPGLDISRKDRKHVVTNMYFKLYRYGLVYKSL